MPADDTFRRAHLVWAVQHVLARTRGRVAMQGPYDAIVEGPGPTHGVHLLLTILFMGFWLPIWLLAIILHKRAVYRIAVDPEGVLSVYEATSGKRCVLSQDGILRHVG